ncbi:MAG: PfkB family carbohydrate kinase [Promethearchaeota archaeon]
MVKEVFESDIVIIGHIAKDIIEIDGVSKSVLGGAVYYGGLAGSRMGLRIAIITRLKAEDFSILESFEKNNIKYFAYPAKETSGIKNIYSSQNMEYRSYEPLGFAGAFKKEEIPDIKTKFFVIGSIIAGEIDLELLEYLSERYNDKLGLDIQGFLRGIKDNQMQYFSLTEKEKVEIISKVDYLKVDETEAKILTNLSSLQKAGKQLINLGPKEVLITHQRGINLTSRDESYFFPWKNKGSVGRTGRGDTAFISYLGSRITKSPEDSLRYSAALTSLKMESMEPFSLPLSAVEELIGEDYNQ